MTYLFTNIRLSIYLIVGALSAVVLSFGAYFASLFLPNLHHDYTIFAVVVPAITILFLLIFLIFTHVSQPRSEAIALFILTVLWLALGAWTVDRRDFLSYDSDCTSWGDQRTPTKKGTISARSYCNEMKVVEAFSWVNFGIFFIWFATILYLTSKASRLGRPYAWIEPMLELGWFGEYPGYSGGRHSDYPTYREGEVGMMQPGMIQPGMIQPSVMQPGVMQPGVQMQPQYGPGGGYVVQQNAGHSIVIQPGVNGEPPRITQVPGTISAV